MLPHQRTRRAVWQQTYRRRVREGAKLIEVSAAVVEMLLSTHWLRESEADDRRAISRALHAMVNEPLTARVPRIFR
jgi:hypothetical protein